MCVSNWLYTFIPIRIIACIYVKHVNVTEAIQMVLLTAPLIIVTLSLVFYLNISLMNSSVCWIGFVIQ